MRLLAVFDNSKNGKAMFRYYRDGRRISWDDYFRFFRTEAATKLHLNTYFWNRNGKEYTEQVYK